MGLEFVYEGLSPIEYKTTAIKNAKVPENVSELKAFLGMVQYYHSFLPNLASILEPLHALLRKNVTWSWTKKCQKAYELCKEHFTSCRLLVHYDTQRELRLACDASSYWVESGD